MPCKTKSRQSSENRLVWSVPCPRTPPDRPNTIFMNFHHSLVSFFGFCGFFSLQFLGQTILKSLGLEIRGGGPAPPHPPTFFVGRSRGLHGKSMGNPKKKEAILSKNDDFGKQFCQKKNSKKKGQNTEN